MKTKLFCYHCEKEYETELDKIEYVQRYRPKSLTLHDRRYYFDDGCFFKTLTQLKLEEQRRNKDA